MCSRFEYTRLFELFHQLVQVIGHAYQLTDKVSFFRGKPGFNEYVFCRLTEVGGEVQPGFFRFMPQDKVPALVEPYPDNRFFLAVAAGRPPAFFFVFITVIASTFSCNAVRFFHATNGSRGQAFLSYKNTACLKPQV